VVDLVPFGEVRRVDARPAPDVVHKVGRDPEQIVAAVRVALVADIRAEEPIVGLLQEIVGQTRVARHS